MPEPISLRLRVFFPCVIAFGSWAMACGRTEQDGPEEGVGGLGGDPAPAGGNSSGGVFSSGGENMGGVPDASGGTSSGGTAPAGSGGGFVGPDGRCVPGTYQTSPLLDALACAPWTTCEPGEKVTRIGTRTEDRLCKPCETNTFSAEENIFSCTPIKACAFDEDLATPGTKTTDAVCEPNGLFTPVPVHSSDEIIGMTATEDGVYVLVGDPFLYGQARMLRYSLAGEPLDEISFGTDIATAQSMTSIGSDLYVSGKTREEGPYDDPKTYVRRFDEAGTLLSEELFDDQADSMRIATDGTNLFLASDGRFPGELLCYDDPEYCFQTFYEALVLRRFDQDGTLQAEQIVADERGGAVWVVDLAVTGTGDAFVLGAGDGLFPNAHEFVAGFDANFDLIRVHPTAALGCSPCSSLAGDEGGQISVFGRHQDLSSADFSVARLESDGTITSIIPVDVGGHQLKAIATAPDVLYLGGETFLSEATLFLRLKPDGTVVDEETHSARIRQTVTAIAIAPNGKAFAAGIGYELGRQVFVTPWPSGE